MNLSRERFAPKGFIYQVVLLRLLLLGGLILNVTITLESSHHQSYHRHSAGLIVEVIDPAAM